jgi:radical SAM protein with 4Fe4S-binding SPASM domain
MNPDIEKIIEYSKDMEVEILTNAALLNEKKIKTLGQKYPQLKRVKISIDGLRGHNVNRRPSCYQKIIANLKAFKKYTKCGLIVNTVITKYSVEDLPKLYEVLKEIPINVWRIDLPFLAGRYKSNVSFSRVRPERVVFVINKVLEKYFKDNKPFGLEIFNLYKSSMVTNKLFRFNINLHPCAYSRWRTLCVKPNGDVTFCPSLLTPLSNILDPNGKVNVSQALNEARADKFFSIKVKNIKKCVACRYLNICGSGCRADALYWRGDLLKPDPVACKYMHLMEKQIIPTLPNKEASYLSKLIKKENGFKN